MPSLIISVLGWEEFESIGLSSTIVYLDIMLILGAVTVKLPGMSILVLYSEQFLTRPRSVIQGWPAWREA